METIKVNVTRGADLKELAEVCGGGGAGAEGECGRAGRVLHGGPRGLHAHRGRGQARRYSVPVAKH